MKITQFMKITVEKQLFFVGLWSWLADKLHVHP
jgi:hypothetical protein